MHTASYAANVDPAPPGVSDVTRIIESYMRPAAQRFKDERTNRSALWEIDRSDYTFRHGLQTNAACLIQSNGIEAITSEKCYKYTML